jgi:hypothetical protein
MTSLPRVVTSRFVSYHVDSATRSASLVVNPLDDFRNEPPTASLRVLLKEQPLRSATTNASGHFVFLDVPDGTYTLIVEPDPINADWYFLRPTGSESWRKGFERAVTLPKENPQEPVEAVTLTPKPGYPFPAGTTLLLGRVRLNGGPAQLAVVTTSYKRVKKDDPDQEETVDLETATDANGYFVLSFHSLPADEQSIDVTAVFGGGAAIETVLIREGATTMTAIDLP